MRIYLKNFKLTIRIIFLFNLFTFIMSKKQLHITRKLGMLSYLCCLETPHTGLTPINGNSAILFYNKHLRSLNYLCFPEIYKKTENLKDMKLKKSLSVFTILKNNFSKFQNNANKRKNDLCVVPNLSSLGIKEITNLVGITIGVAYISWAKISVAPLAVLDWDAKLLPADFRTSQDESNVLKLAYDVKHVLPDSDIYVMETFSINGKNKYSKINMIQLLSMLTILLNGNSTDSMHSQKVVFQKAFVMNKLYNLLVSSERVSTRSTVEDILNNSTKESPENVSKNDYVDIYSTITISSKFLNFYNTSVLEKKEDLSLALLLTLSFLDINIFKNKNSLLKLQQRVWRYK